MNLFLSPDEPVMRLKKARETNDLSLESYFDALYIPSRMHKDVY